MLPRLDRPVPVQSSSALPTGLAVLGSTGSIGTQTLEIASLFPDRLRIEALAAGSNWELLAEQARTFRPGVVAISDDGLAGDLRRELSGTGVRVVAGEEGLEEVASLERVQTVVAAIVGFAGLRSTLAALRAGKRVALANKEALVVAGELVSGIVRSSGAEILPVDSEHSAIFQCLVGEPPAGVESLTLTASGGPFRDRSVDTFDAITPAEALRHPNWSMGAKITIDSATMMNKGLEVIEAHWLFGLDADQINVLIHPQSIIHSMVAFRDGSLKAQLGIPDMRVPIQYALTFPDRWPAPHPRIDWAECMSLDFAAPDPERFPALDLAFGALEQGGLHPVVLNAANEAAVDLFLKEQIRFTDIARTVEAALADAPRSDGLSLEVLEEVDLEARLRARELHTSLTV